MQHRRTRLIRALVTSALIVTITGLTAQVASQASAVEPICTEDIPETGALQTTDLPEGSDASDCDAIGRTIVSPNGMELQIPVPGEMAGTEEIAAESASTIFEVEVDEDGTIGYEGGSEASNALDVFERAPATPPECNQSAHNEEDLKVRGTYEFWIGDGNFPAGLTRSGFQDKVVDSLNNIIQVHTNCDGVSADVTGQGSLKGWSDYEADISETGCGDGSTDGRDHVSVWDAGNIQNSLVAKTCYWGLPMAGMKNSLLEADVRFNIADHDFTVTPGSDSCDETKDYDVVSVAPTRQDTYSAWGTSRKPTTRG